MLALIAATMSCRCSSDNRSNTVTTNNLPDSTIWHAEANADGSQLLYTHSRNVVGLWHAHTSKTTWLEPRLANNMLRSFIPNGSHFVVGGFLPYSDPTKEAPVRVLFYDTKSAQVEQQVDLPPNTSDILCINEDWIVVALSSADPSQARNPLEDSVAIWQRKGNQWVHAGDFRKPTEDGFIHAVHFVDDHNVIARVSYRNEDSEKGKRRHRLIVVDLDTQQTLRQTTIMAKEAGATSVSEGGRFVGVGGGDLVEIYDTSSMTLCGTADMIDVAGTVPCVSVSCDGRYVAYAGASLEVRDLHTNAIVFKDKSHKEIVQSKHNLAELSGDEVAQRYPIKNDGWLREEFCFEYVSFVDASKKLVAVTRAGDLKIWDTVEWKSLVAQRLTEPHVLKTIEARLKCPLFLYLASWK